MVPPAAPPTAPAEDGRKRNLTPWLIAIPVLLLLGIIAWAVAQGGDDPDTTANDPGTSQSGEPQESSSAPATSEATSEAPSETAAATVDVDPDDYVGRPVDDVVAELEGLGLDTTTEEQENLGTEEAGTVDFLDPTGSVEKGSTITVSYWGDPVVTTPTEPPGDKPSKADKPDQGNGKGNKG
jgi:serine/threonine-protein kinase